MVLLKSLVMACYGYTIYLFCKHIFERKFSNAITAVAFLLYEPLIDYQLIGKLVRNYFLAVGLSQVGLIFLMLCLLKGPVTNKLAISTVIFTVQELASFAVESFLASSFFLVGQYNHVAYPEWVYRSMGMVRYLICCLLLIFISRRCGHLYGITSAKSGAWMLIPSVFIILSIETAFYVFHEVQLFQTLQQIRTGGNHISAYPFDTLFLLLISSAGLLANLTILFGVNHSVRQDFAAQRQCLQIRHYQALLEQRKRIISIKHDIKNHNIALAGLAEAGEWDQLKRYLNQMLKAGGVSAGEIHTGNQIVDAILNEKAAIAGRCGISFSCDVKLPRINSVNDYDLCVILGNALDNALEACEKCEIGSRFIHVRSCSVKSYFILEIKNSMTPVAAATPLRSAKQDGELHGMGLEHIRGAVKKHHGTMDISIEKGQFCLSLMLPL